METIEDEEDQIVINIYSPCGFLTAGSLGAGGTRLAFVIDTVIIGGDDISLRTILADDEEVTLPFASHLHSTPDFIGFGPRHLELDFWEEKKQEDGWHVRSRN